MLAKVGEQRLQVPSPDLNAAARATGVPSPCQAYRLPSLAGANTSAKPSPSRSMAPGAPQYPGGVAIGLGFCGQLPTKEPSPRSTSVLVPSPASPQAPTNASRPGEGSSSASTT